MSPSGAPTTTDPSATYALLAGATNNLENGLELAPFPDDGDPRRAVRNREEDTIHLLDPPALDAAQSIIALDGTPTPVLWNLTLGVDLKERQVLDDDERRDYIEETLALKLVRTTDKSKSYSPKPHYSVS